MKALGAQLIFADAVYVLEAHSPAVVALAVIALEGVVQRAAVAGRDLRRLGGPRSAEVEGVREDAQKPDQAVQLPHPVLRGSNRQGTTRGKRDLCTTSTIQVHAQE